MRIIVAKLSVVYSGRGDTYLAPAVRALIIKPDGSVSIHNAVGNKPLNYMGAGNELTVVKRRSGRQLWSFDTRKESIQVTLHHIISDVECNLDLDSPVLERDGTESQLQAWLSENVEVLGAGFMFGAREYPTGAGAVDLLVADAGGVPVVVEVKRVAMLGAVDQVRRYVSALREQEGFEDVRGVIAALDIRPKTLALAEKHGIECVTVPDDWRQ